MIRIGPLLILLLVSVATARAEDDAPTAASTTERGRSLARILDMALVPGGAPVVGPRTMLILLDPSPSLVQAGFGKALVGAVQRHREALGDTRFLVRRTGERGKATPLAVDQAAALGEAIDEVLQGASTAIRNVYEDTRRAAQELRRHRGARDLLLVTLENGDGEDDIEGTAAALRGADVRLTIVAREAFLSDSYWLSRKPPSTRLAMAGADGAFVELPWGYVFQQHVANESVASGFPIYGLGRLAAATGGRVYLYYPASGSKHACAVYGACPFCRGDHLPHGEGYQSHRLRALAPSIASRRDAALAAVRDPYYRAVLAAWDQAARKGLLRSRPSIKAGGAIVKRPVGTAADFGRSTSFSGQAGRADKLVRVADGILHDLESHVAGIDDGDGTLRGRAIADTTLAMLRITRMNLLLYAAFCREVAPRWVKDAGDELELPEIAFYTGKERFTGVGFTNLSLCHGVQPFRELYLPGGETTRRELDALDASLETFLRRYAHTPFAAVVRRSGLARFTLTTRGKYVPPPKRRVPGSTEDETTTETDRPTRAGTPASGTGGPTSGGG